MLPMNRALSKTRFLSRYCALHLRNSSVGGFTMKGISVAVVTLLCFGLPPSLQSAERWKPLFNGQDFTGWTVPARGGAPSLNPADAGWKIENGLIVGGQAGPGQRS